MESPPHPKKIVFLSLHVDGVPPPHHPVDGVPTTPCKDSFSLSPRRWSAPSPPPCRWSCCSWGTNGFSFQFHFKYNFLHEPVLWLGGGGRRQHFKNFIQVAKWLQCCNSIQLQYNRFSSIYCKRLACRYLEVAELRLSAIVSHCIEADLVHIQRRLNYVSLED